MSRARNIKPGFFKNDRLAECDPLARILFAGLWCEADRAGRLEDRPKRLKADCLPYDDCDIDALLAQLVRAGFVVRYVVDGNRFISIPNFAKHQNPHVREPASSIPAPDEHCASTVPEPAEHGTGPADSPSLIPDPSSQKEHAPSKDGASKRGSRLPADWLPSIGLVDAMTIECPQVDQTREIAKFRDHWAAAPGAKGVKLNWDSTYRNWIRTAAERLPRNGNGQIGRESVADRAARFAREGDEREARQGRDDFFP